MDRTQVPGWAGSVGPFPSQYQQEHVYARDVNSGAGNCVCGRALGHQLHVQAAPGVVIPGRERVGVAAQLAGNLRAEVRDLLARHGPESVARALAEEVADVQLFTATMHGGEIWAITTVQVTPPWRVRRLERVLAVMEELAVLADWRSRRLGWGRLVIGMRGERDVVGRALEALRLTQDSWVPRAELEFNPRTGRWDVRAPAGAP